MTVINPNSISGITSITLPSGDGNVLTIHTNDGTERFRIDSSGNVKVGSAATISPDGDLFVTGVCTATTLSGAASGLTGALPAIDGSALTGIAATDNVRTGILDVAGISTFRNTMNVGAAVTISESGIEASGIGITVANINGGAISGRRNLVINGAMTIAQRGASSTSSATSATYQVDRFFTFADATDNASFTHAQVTDAPTGFSKSFKLSVDTAETTLDSNEVLQFIQRIEAQDLQHLHNGLSTAKPVTLSFYVKSYQTGVFNVNLYKPDNTARQITATYTVNQSATWEFKTITFPGDTSGGGINDDTGRGLSIYYHLAAGSGTTSSDSTSWGNYSAAGSAYGQAVNLMSSTDNYWQITGVQLEVGSEATAFEHRGYGEELRLCSRYYQRISGDNGTAIAMAFNYNTSLVDWVLQYPMGPMRATPSLDQSTGSDYFQYQGSVDGVVHLDGSFVLEQGTTTQANIYFDPDGSLTHGGIGYILVDNSSASLALSSEL